MLRQAFAKTGERYECWLSPDGWAKYRERKQRIERERRAAVYADPVRLAKYREGMARRAREQRLADPVPAMLRAAKGRAKARSVPFDLTPADVVVPKRCRCSASRLRSRWALHRQQS